MEQTAAVHAQFLSTQRHAQETVRMLLGGGGQALKAAPEPHQTNGISNYSGNGNGQYARSAAPMPTVVPEVPVAAAPKHVSEAVVSTGMPIPAPTTVYSNPAPVVMEVEEAGDVFAAPAAWTPPAPVAVVSPVVAPVASTGSAPSALAGILLEIVSE